MSGAQNVHRILGARTRLQREALAGPCRLHEDHKAVGYIEDWAGHPKGACEACCTFGEQNGYHVVRTAALAAYDKARSDAPA